MVMKNGEKEEMREGGRLGFIWGVSIGQLIEEGGKGAFGLGCFLLMSFVTCTRNYHNVLF